MTIRKGALLIGGAAALSLVSGAVGAALSSHFGTSSYTLSYADFISIMLTAISLLMTLIAMILAVLGVIGWNAIAERVRQRTEEFLGEGFKDGALLSERIKNQAAEVTNKFLDDAVKPGGILANFARRGGREAIFEGVPTIEGESDDEGEQ